MPVAIMVLGVALLLTSALALATTRSSASSNDDLAVKRAVQAADAGLDAARSALLGVQPSAGQCIDVRTSAAGTAPVGALYPRLATTTEVNAGYCTALTASLADGASYSWRMSTSASDWKVVSTGSTAGATATSRRIAASLKPGTSAESLFEYAFSSDESIAVSGTDVTGSIRTNGSMSMSSMDVIGSIQALGNFTASGSSVSGNVRYGPTGKYSASGTTVNGTRTADATKFEFPANPGAAISTVAADTSNSRICVAAQDPCSSGGTISGYGTRGFLTMSSKTVTLTGTKPYVFCNISASGSNFIIPVGSSVKILIDSRENCGGSGGSISMSRSTFDNQNCTAQPFPSATLQLYMLGSPTASTGAALSDTSQCLTLFAPRTDFSMSGGAINGAIAVKSAAMSGVAAIANNASAQSIKTGTPSGAVPYSYRECVTPTASSDGCAAATATP